MFSYRSVELRRAVQLGAARSGSGVRVSSVEFDLGGHKLTAYESTRRVGELVQRNGLFRWVKASQRKDVDAMAGGQLIQWRSSHAPP